MNNYTTPLFWFEIIYKYRWILWRDAKACSITSPGRTTGK